MLEKVFWGNTLKDWGISLLIVAGGLLICKAFMLINKHFLKKIVAKNTNRFVDMLFSTWEKPVVFGVMITTVWIAFKHLTVSQDVYNVVEKAYLVLPILNITWFISQFASAIIDDLSQKSRFLDPRLLPLARRGVLIVIWVIGVITALSNAGVNLAAILGLLGVGGVTIALAFQDTFKNIIGGITIFTDRPFSLGDKIQFDSFEGVVKDIGLRSTRILTDANRVLTVPNSKLVDATVVNIAKEPSRRVLVNLGLTYDTTYEKMREAIEILKSIPAAVAEIENDTIAVFSEFGDSALIITYIYYIRKNTDIRESTSKVNFEILTRFNNAGLNFAYPTITVSK